jgi:pyruvate dehydrogenase E1 component alpha subunit
VRAHSLSDAEYRYRAKDAGNAWLQSNDPIARLRDSLLGDSKKQLDEIDESVKQEIKDARAAAIAMPSTPPSAAMNHLYASADLSAS